MDNSCDVLSLDHGQYAVFSKHILRHSASRRMPIKGGIALTENCNLRCIHCYASFQNHAQNELSFKELKKLFDQLFEEGCLWLLLTGGEPFLRKDFVEIYAYLKKKGFLIIIFSNGTLINQEHACLLEEFPPFYVEISIYGASEHVYESVTGVKGSYKACLKGIKLLLEHKIPLKLKTVILKQNSKELHQMEDFARRLGLEFRFDTMIAPRVDGSLKPTQHRISPQEVFECEKSHPRRLQRIEILKKLQKSEKNDSLFTCAATRSGFHITSQGRLNLCVYLQKPNYDLRKGSFRLGFYEAIPSILSRKISKDPETCGTCDMALICKMCPAWGYLEHDDPQKPIPYLCEVAKLRKKIYLEE